MMIPVLCPRPCNGRPVAFPQASCVAAGECGCGATGEGHQVIIDTEVFDDLLNAANRLIQRVEFDVNGTRGKGGNGGLTSDDTIRAAGELRILISKVGKEA